MKKLLFFGVVTVVLVFCPSCAYAAGTNVDFATASNYDLKIIGEVGGGGIIGHNMTPVDIDADGKQDLLINSYFGSNQGSIYLIYGSLLQTFQSGSTINLTDSSNYSVKFKGGPFSGYGTPAVGDIDGDGKSDIAFNSALTPDGGGSVWVIFNTKFGALTGTGNVVDLSDSANYNFVFHSSYDSDNSNFGYMLDIKDVNGNGRGDLIIGDPYSSQAQVHSGQLYVIFDDIMTAYGGSSGNDMPLATTTNFSALFVRNGGNSPNFSNGDFQAVDLDGDSALDLVIGSRNEDFSFDDSGSVYIINNSIFGNLTGTGHIFDMTSGSSYTLRIDGSASGDDLANWIVNAKDVTSDGLVDLVIAASRGSNNSRALSGSVYVISNSLFSSYTGTGNTTNLTSSANWTTRIDGAVAGDRLGNAGTIADVDNDGKNDLLIGSGTAGNNGRSLSGSFYMLSQPLFALSGTGNTLDLASSSAYTLRMDGAEASSRLTGYPDNATKAAAGFDVNGDGQNDMLTASRTFQSGSSFGAVFVVFSFPHTFSITSGSQNLNTSPTISGSLDASSWLFPISEVQYQLDGSALTGNWQSCSASDGTFDATTESFSCQLNGLGNGENHTLYVRALDSNGFYTANDGYQFGFSTFGSSGGSGGGSNINQPTNYKLVRNAGPGFVGQQVWIPTQNDGGALGAVFVPNTASNIDLWVTPLSTFTPNVVPWAQGLNSYSGFLSLAANSAFNGYPYLVSDNFFSISIAYDLAKLKGLNPKNLKIAYLDQNTNTWKILDRPSVVNYQNHTLATTTKFFTTYNVVYPNTGAVSKKKALTVKKKSKVAKLTSRDK